MIGEHGDSEFVPWSNSLVSVIPVTECIRKEKLEEIALSVKNSAYDIIEKKGATYYGIGMCLVRITNAILDNDNSILALSVYDEEKDLYYGMPAIINKNGIKKRVKLNLTEEEKTKLNESIRIINSYKEKLR